MTASSPTLPRTVVSLIAAAGLVGAITATAADAAEPDAALPASPGPLAVDRAAVRFVAPDTGGVLAPQIVFERVLAFEARLLALTEGAKQSRPRPRHVRAALERHIAETLLAARTTKPAPTEAELAQRTADAQSAMIQRVGGETAYTAAFKAEGLSRSEVRRLLRRRARASLHLDRMNARILSPELAELRVLHRTGQTPFSAQEFEVARGPLARWLVSRRVDTALDDFFRSARGRVTIHWLPRPRARGR